MFAGENSGLIDFKSAAAAVTSGVANEVPLLDTVVAPGLKVKTISPGAATSTPDREEGVRYAENEARVSEDVVAPTANEYREFAGYATRESTASEALFPLAAKTGIPEFLA